MIVISFIALATVGGISFATSYKLNGYYTRLSANRVSIIETYGDLNGSFNEQRIYLTRI